MNNDTNNNMNGEVLGTVDNTVNQIPETLEPTNVPNNAEVLNTPQSVVNAPVENIPPVVENPVPNPSQVMDYQAMMPAGPNELSNQVNNNGISQVNASPLNPENVVINGPTPVAPNLTAPSLQENTPPAYTNPNQINPAPMPGFENPGSIGTTPPISLEPEKQPKKKTNKTLFIIIILVLLVGVGFGTYYILNYTDLIKKVSSAKVTVNNLDLELGQELSKNINDYAEISGTDSKNCSLDTSKVNINVAGVYSYTVTCGETVKSGTVTVVSTQSEVINTKTVYKVKGSTLDASEFIEEPDSSYTYSFVNEEEVANILNGDFGTYSISINASNGGNTKELTATLVIMRYQIKGYLSCTSNSQVISDGDMTVSERFAIVEDGNNGYGNIAMEIYSFKISDEDRYSEYVSSSQNGSITINDITGKASFDDSTHTITITVERDNSDVISSYGESNMINYSSIRNYFTTTLGYTCNYEKLS